MLMRALKGRGLPEEGHLSCDAMEVRMKLCDMGKAFPAEGCSRAEAMGWE